MGDTSLPEKTKAARAYDLGPDFKLVIEDVPMPTPGPTEILIRLNVTGICYSDIHYMLEDIPIPSMTNFDVRSPGHEGVGKVVAIGPGVTEWAIGDRAGIKPVWSTCQACDLCWSDREMYCSKALQSGIHKTGSYQQYVICNEFHAVRIPDKVEDAVAAPIMCSGATIYRGIVESGLKPGDWAVFAGAGGGVGHMGVQYAKALGLQVIAVDGGDAKRDLCMKLGATEFVDFTKTKDIPAEIIRITGGQGAHGVFVTASTPAAYRDAVGMLRIGGILMCIGIPPQIELIPGAFPMSLLGRNIKLTGTIVGTRNDVAKALSFAERGMIKPELHFYPFSGIEEAVRRLQKGDVSGRCIVKFDE